MAVSYAQFIVEFPEFDQITQAYVQSKLDASAAQNELGAFGSEERHDQAVYHFAADMLARSPYGTQMQLVNDDGLTVYGEYYKNVLLPRIHRRGQITGGGLT